MTGTAVVRVSVTTRTVLVHTGVECVHEGVGVICSGQNASPVVQVHADRS